jgi:hypothetical protein
MFTTGRDIAGFCDKTRKCDVTGSVTGRVQVLCHRLVQLVQVVPRPKTTPTCAMSHPRLEPVVLINSLPPGSPIRKRRDREELSDAPISSPQNRQSRSQRVDQRGKGMYVCESRSQSHGSSSSSLIYHSPSTQVQVVLPPSGSWKRRLLDEVGNQRHIFGQRSAPGS